MRGSSLGIVVIAAALAALSGCGKRQVSRTAVLFSPQCEIVPDSLVDADVVTLALSEPVDPHFAPWARNTSESRLFRHLYETLITVDCLGDVQSGLAVSWDRSVDGRLWTFELQGGARFWDGHAVTARDVVWSWQNAPVDPASPDALFDSVTANGDRSLRVYLKQPRWSVPRAFSSLTFAVAKPAPDRGWPIGSGVYEFDTGSQVDSIVLRPSFGARGSVVRVLQSSSSDARDLLDGTVDVLTTRDPAVIEYAAQRPQLRAAALPWDRTYVLLSTSRVRDILWGGSTGGVTSDLTDGLARDVVRSDARGVHPPFWWEELGRCGELTETVEGLPPFPRGSFPSGGARRILYDAQDPTARDLAERLVALASTDTATSAAATALASAVPGVRDGSSVLAAHGVTSRELRSGLEKGIDFGYVVAVNCQPPNPCDEAGKLLQRAPWLAPLGERLSQAPIPLVDTRQHVIVRRGVASLIVDWYGDFIVANGMLQRR